MDDHQNLVSIIIPNRNHQRWLGVCLGSCLKQTYPWIEIIVVDDASTDDSCAFIEASFGSQVRLIRMAQHKGPAAARNVGMQSATGSYIQFLDADDFIAPHKIEIQMNKMHEENTDLCTAFWRNCYSGTFGDLFGPVQMIDKKTNLLVQTIQDKQWMPIMSLLIKRQFLERVGAWREDLEWNEDREYRYRMLRLHPKVSFAHEELFFYRDHFLQKRSGKSEALEIRVAVDEEFIRQFLFKDGEENVFLNKDEIKAATFFIRNHAKNLKINYEKKCHDWNDLADKMDGGLSSLPQKISGATLLRRVILNCVKVTIRYSGIKFLFYKLRSYSQSTELVFRWAQSWYGHFIKALLSDA